MNQRANTAIFVALTLSVLLGFAALVVDLGHARLMRWELQTIADGAALAGAMGLADNTCFDLAEHVTSANQVGQQAISLTPGQVETGWWDGLAFHTDNSWPHDAVHVHLEASSLVGFFASVLAFDGLTTSVDAVAIASLVHGPGAECMVYATSTLTVGGSALVDAYDSSEGPYTGGDGGGSLCSAGAMGFENNADVLPDAYSGGDLEVRNNARFSGQHGPLDEPLVLPDIDWDHYAQLNDNAQLTWTGSPDPVQPGPRLDVRGTAEVTLPAGTYYFTTLDIGGGGRVLTEGEVSIYVLGNVSALGNGIVNTDQAPGNLSLVSGGDEVRIGGNEAAYMNLVAADAEVSLFAGATDFYGTLLGGFIDLQSVSLHMDLAQDPWVLGNGGPPEEVVMVRLVD